MKRTLLAIACLLLLSLCLCAGALAEPVPAPITTALGGVISFDLPPNKTGDVGVKMTREPADPIAVTYEDGNGATVTEELPGIVLNVKFFRDEIDWLSVYAKYNFSIAPTIRIPSQFTHCLRYTTTSFKKNFAGHLEGFPTTPQYPYVTAKTPLIEPMEMDARLGLFIPKNCDENDPDEGYGNYGLVRWYNGTDYKTEYIQIIATFNDDEPFLMDAHDVPADRIVFNTENIAKIGSAYEDGCVAYIIKKMDKDDLDKALRDSNKTLKLKTHIDAPSDAIQGTVSNNEYADTEAIIKNDNNGKLYCELTTNFYEYQKDVLTFCGGPGNKEFISITWQDADGKALKRETIDCEMRYEGFEPVGFDKWTPVTANDKEIINPLEDAGVECDFRDADNALLYIDFSKAKTGYNLSQPIQFRVKAPEGAARAKWICNTTHFWDDEDNNIDSISDDFWDEDPVVNGYWTFTYSLVERVKLPGSDLSIYFADGMQDISTYIRWLDADRNTLRQNAYRASATGLSVDVKETNAVKEKDLADEVAEPTVCGLDNWKLAIEVSPSSGGNSEYYDLRLINPRGETVTNPSDPATIYLPYPDGIRYETAANYAFTLTHYNYNFKNPTNITLTPTPFGLRFASDSFSPFVLAYKKKPIYVPPVSTPTPAPTPVPTPTPTPAPGNSVGDPNPDTDYPGEGAPNYPEMPEHPSRYYAPSAADYAVTLQGGSDDIPRLVMFTKQKLDLRLWDKSAEVDGAQWTSTDENVFTVNAKGVLTAKKATGKAYLLGLDASKRYGMVLIEVTDKGKTPRTVVAKPKKIEVAVGEKAPITVSTKPNGVAAQHFWHSLNPRVATVEGGVVTGVGAGKTDIIIRVQSGKYDSVAVVVSDKAGVTSLKLKKEASIKVGGVKTLKLTIKPKREKGAVIAWTSSDEAVATVDAAGTVAGVAPGQATITATSENGLTASCLLTVK